MPNPNPSSLIRGALAAWLAVSSLGAAAQATPTLTLYGGARAGGEFEDASDAAHGFKLDSAATVAASFDWPLDDGRIGQVFYSFQRSALPGADFGQPAKVDVDVSYLHLGGRVFLEGDPVRGGSYAVGGLGATFFSPRQAGLSNEVRPSFNLGVGWQWTVSRNVALRGELRGYLSLINSSGQFFCSGGCVVSIRGTTLTQAEGMVGVSIGF